MSFTIPDDAFEGEFPAEPTDPHAGLKLARVAITVQCLHCDDQLHLRPDLIGTDADIDDQTTNVGAEIAAALADHWTNGDCS